MEMDEPRVDKDEQDGMKRGRIDLSVCIHKAPSEELFKIALHCRICVRTEEGVSVHH